MEKSKWKTALQLRLEMCVHAHNVADIDSFVESVKDSVKENKLVVSEYGEHRSRRLSPLEADKLQAPDGGTLDVI